MENFYQLSFEIKEVNPNKLFNGIKKNCDGVLYFLSEDQAQQALDFLQSLMEPKIKVMQVG